MHSHTQVQRHINGAKLFMGLWGASCFASITAMITYALHAPHL